MPTFLTRWTAIALLTAGVSVATGLSGRADMGHGHTAPAPTDMPPTDHGEGHHGTLEVPADRPLPSVRLTASPDPVSGWNLQIQTEHWVFAPERVNQSSLITEGHAHLYLNGEKLTRLYSNWYYLPSLPPGEHTLTVGLNANGHEALTYQGIPIEDAVVITVPEP